MIIFIANNDHSDGQFGWWRFRLHGYCFGEANRWWFTTETCCVGSFMSHRWPIGDGRCPTQREMTRWWLLLGNDWSTDWSWLTSQPATNWNLQNTGYLPQTSICPHTSQTIIERWHLENGEARFLRSQLCDLPYVEPAPTGASSAEDQEDGSNSHRGSAKTEGTADRITRGIDR